jgi:hypothetical protein
MTVKDEGPNLVRVGEWNRHEHPSGIVRIFGRRHRDRIVPDISAGADMDQFRQVLPGEHFAGIHEHHRVRQVRRRAGIAHARQPELGLMDVKVVQLVGGIHQLPDFHCPQLGTDMPDRFRRVGVDEPFGRKRVRVRAVWRIDRAA